MHKHPSREELMQRLAAMEAALKRQTAEHTGDAWDARYRILFERATDAIFIENDRDEILDVNPKACELLGYTREELIGMTVPDIQAPECRGEKGKVLQGELEDHRGMPFEAVDLHKDGTRIPVEVTNNRLNEEGLFLSIVRDIRERKAAEQVRREAYHILEKSPVVAFLWRNAPDWPVEYVTPNVSRLFGYTAEDFLTGSILYSSVVHPDDLERVAGEVEANSQDAKRSEFTHAPYRIVDCNGDIRWISDSTFIRRDSSGAITHFQGIVTDVTDRIQAEEALRRSEERYRNFVEHSIEGIWLLAFDEPISIHLDPEEQVRRIQQQGYLAECNDVLAQHYGYASRHDMIGMRLMELYGDVPSEMNFKTTLELVKSGYRANARETVEKSANGELVYFHNNAVGIIENDNLVAIWGTQRDITEQRIATNALQDEKRRLAVTLRSIGDAVITTDREGCITLMNPIAESLTGWQEANAVGRPLMEVFRIVNEHTREPCTNPVDKVLETGQIVGLANHTMLLARDGREFIIADSGAPIFDDERAIIGVVLVFRDTTERERMEKELLKMEKIQSLGVLAGGIAHDFNNFLTGIVGNLSLAKLELESGNSINRPMEEMEKAALRAKELTQQLLTFSRGGEPVKHTADIAGLVREAAQFALRGSNVRSDLHIEEDLRFADIDEGQIVQVLHNLVLNADQAMPEGGTITLRGINIALPFDNPYALPPGDYIQLSIEDQGMGIQPDHQKRVFDPYFTTKQKGSGLGLAVAYSVITKHDGRLTVDSQLGGGTTFTILLPASDGPLKPTAEDQHQPIKGSGFILVMDDEDFIRDLAQRMLTTMGYRADVVPDGQSALDRYRQAQSEGDPFDVVILDLTVPGGMGGKETLQHLQELDPEVRAIVSSGYANDPIMAHYRQYGFCGAVKKPYLLKDIHQKLAEVLKR